MTQRVLDCVRGVVSVRLLVLIAGVLAVACSTEEPAAPPTETEAVSLSDQLAGMYELVGDVDGVQVNEGARVTLTLLADGTLTLLAEQPGETLTDDGSWEVADDVMSVAFTGLEVSAEGGAYSFDGTTLDIPVLIFGEGDGASRWRRVDPIVSGTPGTSADDDSVAFTPDFDTDWDEYDLDNDPVASAMRTYVESVNDRGLGLAEAVAAAADEARRSPDVAEVVISPNGLNAVIRFHDGREDELLTERFTLSEVPLTSATYLPSSSLIGWTGANDAGAAVAASANHRRCDSLPVSPVGNQVINGTRVAEPGREGLVPSSVFGVPAYNPTDHPAPLQSDDSPAPDARRALIVAPLYRVPHPGPSYGPNGEARVGMWSGFAAGTHQNVECVTADLRAAGYEVDTIVGRVDRSGQRTATGVEALVQLVTLMTERDYGVVYFLTHGAESVIRQPSGDVPTVKIQMGALDAADRERITGDRGLDPEAVLRLEAQIRDQVLAAAGLPTDDDELRRTISARFDAGRGDIDLWVSADFFRLLRERRGLDFSRTLVFANACSSAANSSLQQAFDARAYFGWAKPPDLDFAAASSSVIFDELVDKTRSVRNAWQMWVRHEGWIEAVARSVAGVERPERARVELLRAYGDDGIEYPQLTSQSVVLIFRMRHGPPAAAGRLATSTELIRNCWTTYWSAGRNVSGLQSTACNAVELGNYVPTQDEVDDALFDVGAGPDRPFGRFTLAD